MELIIIAVNSELCILKSASVALLSPPFCIESLNIKQEDLTTIFTVKV